MNSLAKLLFTLCLIFVSQPPLLLTNARPHSLDQRLLSDGPHMISQICKELEPEYISTCTNILKADPKILHEKNYFEISTAILELGANEATKGQIFLKQLLKTKYSKALDLCANTYYDASIRDFKVAKEQLTGDVETASYDAAVAMDGPATCERLLAEEHIVNPAIYALGNETSLLSAVAATAITILSNL